MAVDFLNNRLIVYGVVSVALAGAVAFPCCNRFLSCIAITHLKSGMASLVPFFSPPHRRLQSVLGHNAYVCVYQLIKSDLLGLLPDYTYYVVAGNRVLFFATVCVCVCVFFLNRHTAVMHHERITRILP